MSSTYPNAADSSTMSKSRQNFIGKTPKRYTVSIIFSLLFTVWSLLVLTEWLVAWFRFGEQPTYPTTPTSGYILTEFPAVLYVFVGTQAFAAAGIFCCVAAAASSCHHKSAKPWIFGAATALFASLLIYCVCFLDPYGVVTWLRD